MVFCRVLAVVVLCISSTTARYVKVPEKIGYEVSEAIAKLKILDGLINGEEKWDSHNTTDITRVLSSSYNELKALHDQLNIDVSRLNTSLRFHEVSHQSLLSKAHQLIQQRDEISSGMAHAAQQCTASLAGLRAQLTVFEVSRDVLVSFLKSNETSASPNIAPVIELLRTNTFTTALIEQSGIPLNNTKVSPTDFGDGLLTQLHDFINRTFEHIQGEIQSTDHDCRLQETVSNHKLETIQKEISWVLQAAHDSSSNIDSLVRERNEILSMFQTTSIALQQLMHYHTIVKEAFDLRVSSRSKIQHKVERLMQEFRAMANSSHPGICHDSQSNSCNSHGDCIDGICVCRSAFSGKFCEIEITCTSAPMLSSGIISNNPHCNGTRHGQTCRVPCDGDSSEHSKVEVECFGGAWKTAVPKCFESGATSCPFDYVFDNLPAFSRVSCSGTLVGDTCDFSCFGGTHPDAHATTTCLPDGTWSPYPQQLCTGVLCNQLNDSMIGNGTVKCDGFRFGDSCTFQCNEGYQMLGPSTTRCLSNSSWFQPYLPICVPTLCPLLPSVQYGRLKCSGSGRHVGDECHVICAEGFWNHVDSTRVCLSSGGWSGLQVRACTPIECSSPPEAKNGVRVCSKNSTTTSCEYMCDGGDQSQHGATLSCQNGGNWLGETNGCDIDRCEMRPPILHGTMNCVHLCDIEDHLLPAPVADKKHREGVSCSITCDDGFELIGEKNVLCNEKDGAWNVNSYCKPRSCGKPPQSNHGIMLCTGDHPGHQCTRHCHGGYGLGTQTALPVHWTCSADGEWVANVTDTDTECHPIPCAIPANPKYGSLNCTGTAYGHICSLVCPSGHVIEGSQDLVCGSDGEWIGKGVCIPEFCKPLPEPEHSTLTCTGAEVGGVCTTRCRDGFQAIAGDSSRKCIPGGVWSGQSLKCDMVRCDRPVSNSGGQWSCVASREELATEHSLPLLSRCTLECPKGEASDGSEWICAESGLWVPELNHTTAPYYRQRCKPIQCGSPPSFEHSRLVCREESRCQVTCDDGFVLTGTQNGLVWCDQNDWKFDRSIACIPSQCGKAPQPLRGASMQCAPAFEEYSKFSEISSQTIDLTSVVGSSCTFVCGTGPSDVYGLLCGSDGIWKPQLGTSYPPCVTTCGIPPAPSNGKISCDEQHTSCTFSCHSGFELVGPSVISCLGQGVWSHEPSSCIPTKCGQPPVLPNGRVVCDGDSFGNACQYVCDMGYVLTGSPTAHCDVNGNWSAISSASCEPKSCSKDTDHTSVAISCHVVNQRVLCEATCAEEYTLVGSEVRQCSAHGVWTGSVPECHRSTCTVRTSPEFGSLICTGHSAGDVCRLECEENHKVVGEAVSKCLKDGTWSGGVPALCL